MEAHERSEGRGRDELGAFAAPAAALPVLVIERAGAEAVWDELLLEPSPPRPVRFVSLEGSGAAWSPADAAPDGGFVVAAAGSAASAALELAADDRVVALLLVDPVAAPVELGAGVTVLVVRSGEAGEGELALPAGAGRAVAVARIRAALAAPPFAAPAR